MSSQRREEVSKRIAGIHGHVHAIKKMLAKGRSYPDVVHQISAVRAGLDEVIQVIVDDLVETCLDKIEKKEPVEETVVELRAVIGKSR